MRTTGSDRAHRLVVDHLPWHLQQLVAEHPGAKTIIVIISSETADELGLVLPTRAARAATSARALPRAAGRRTALTQRRHDVGMTQEGLAHEVGVQTSTVGRWERGVTEPSLWARDRLCRALDVSRPELDVLLGEAGSDPIRVLHVVGPGDGIDAEDAVPAPEIA